MIGSGDRGGEKVSRVDRATTAGYNYKQSRRM